jgi:hypothetical protein
MLQLLKDIRKMLKPVGLGIGATRTLINNEHPGYGLSALKTCPPLQLKEAKRTRRAVGWCTDALQQLLLAAADELGRSVDRGQLGQDADWACRRSAALQQAAALTAERAAAAAAAGKRVQ